MLRKRRKDVGGIYVGEGRRYIGEGDKMSGVRGIYLGGRGGKDIKWEEEKKYCM